MPTLSKLNLPPAVAALLAPWVADKEVGQREEGVWVQRGRIRMELEDLGDGWNGDYDEEDPQDTKLLRFSFYGINQDERGNPQFDQLDNTSCCTAIAADAPWEIQLACACEIFDEIAPKLATDEAVVDPAIGRVASKACDRMSYTTSEGRAELLAALLAAKLDQATPLTTSLSSSSPRL